MDVLDDATDYCQKGDVHCAVVSPIYGTHKCPTYHYGALLSGNLSTHEYMANIYIWHIIYGTHKCLTYHYGSLLSGDLSTYETFLY